MYKRQGLGIAPLPTFIGDPDEELVCVLPEQLAVRRTYWLIVPDTTARLRRTRVVVAALNDMIAARSEAFFGEDAP